MMLGLLMIPVGMIRERRKIRKSGIKGEARFPRIDLNDPRHMNAFIFSQ